MKKFKYAINGLKDAVKEKAVLTQIILGILAIIGGLIIRLDAYECLAFAICITMVISFEIFNSVVEELCNLYSKEKNDRIRKVKDMAAAGVLFSCFGALVVCLICVIKRIV